MKTALLSDDSFVSGAALDRRASGRDGGFRHGATAVTHIAGLPDEMRARLPRGTADYLHRPSNLEDVFLRLTGRKLREP